MSKFADLESSSLRYLEPKYVQSLTGDGSPEVEPYKFCGKPACSFPVSILSGGRAERER